MIKILIIGRPNVGKSTLFNALIRKKLAIVEKSSGTTRDFVFGEYTHSNLYFNFIDSAGIGFYKNEIYEKAKEQIFNILDSADFVLFVVDGKTPPTHEDFYIKNILSKMIHNKVALVINKIDNEKILPNIYEYNKLKCDYMFVVSALMRKGLEEIYEFLYQRFKDRAQEEKEENANIIKIGIIGKRGVGKSSYINAIFNKEVRLVSSKPPTTRDIGVFKYHIFNTNFALYDTAGLFKYKNSNDTTDVIAMKKVSGLIKKVDMVFLMLDVTNYKTQFDKFLCKVILKNKKTLILCFNKIDLLSPEELKSEKKNIDREFPFLRFVPKVFFSSKVADNIHAPFSLAIDLYAQSTKRIKTSYLNKILEKIRTYKTFKRQRKLAKIYYATQVGILPIEIALFVNNKTLFAPTDLKFVENQIRKETGLYNIPITLKLIHRQ